MWSESRHIVKGARQGLSPWPSPGNPVFMPRQYRVEFHRVPDLSWTSPTNGTVIAEVKAGNGGTFSGEQRVEAQKDASIVKSGQAGLAVWHFYPGLGKYNGPSPALVSYLQSLGIAIVVHKYDGERGGSSSSSGVKSNPRLIPVPVPVPEPAVVAAQNRQKNSWQGWS